MPIAQFLFKYERPLWYHAHLNNDPDPNRHQYEEAHNLTYRVPNETVAQLVKQACSIECSHIHSKSSEVLERVGTMQIFFDRMFEESDHGNSKKFLLALLRPSKGGD
jgi:hypothetical protein